MPAEMSFLLCAPLCNDCFLFILTFHYYYYHHHHYTNACMYESVVVCMSACICVFFSLLFLAVIL